MEAEEQKTLAALVKPAAKSLLLNTTVEPASESLLAAAELVQAEMHAGLPACPIAARERRRAMRLPATKTAV